MTETSHLLLKRLGTQAQMNFIESYEKGAFEVFQLTPNHASGIRELMQKYADLPMDLADASLVILAEHIGHGRILSSDRRDFNAYRWGRGFLLTYKIYLIQCKKGVKNLRNTVTREEKQKKKEELTEKMLCERISQRGIARTVRVSRNRLILMIKKINPTGCIRSCED